MSYSPILWSRGVEDKAAVLADPARCTYSTGHGICGELADAGDEMGPVHGIRTALDFGGVHRFRHDPSEADQTP